jgi:hypothetical protein
VDSGSLLQGPKLEMMTFQDHIYQSVEGVKKELKGKWIEV